MSDFFTIVPKPLTNYQALRQKMSPELQEAFLNACLNAGLSEDDWIHSLFAFQGELFSATLDRINAALDGALSTRKAENKKLAELLAACQSSLQGSVTTIGKQAAVSAEQIEALKKEIRQSQQAERTARGGETDQLRRQLEELNRELEKLRRDLPDVYKAAELINKINERALWGLLGIVFSVGAIFVLCIQHLVFHLF